MRTCVCIYAYMNPCIYVSHICRLMRAFMHAWLLYEGGAFPYVFMSACIHAYSFHDETRMNLRMCTIPCARATYMHTYINTHMCLYVCIRTCEQVSKQMKQVEALKKKVVEAAVERLKLEGGHEDKEALAKHDGHVESLALSKYNYYLCGKCER
jgi:hypothetical protein